MKEAAIHNTARVDALVAFYEGLSPANVRRFPEFYAENVVFKDPFNEVRGVVLVQRIFSHLFSQLADPHFVVSERIVSDNGALLVWEMRFRQKNSHRHGPAQIIRGASHLKFDVDGQVVWHRDYWDTAEELYEKLPGIGWLLRLLKGKLAAGPG